MQVCVIGLGTFGTAVALSLAQKGHEVLVIDRDENKVASIEEMVSHALVMDATNEKSLKSLGLKDFDAVIVAITEHIEDSILTTMLVKEEGAKKVIAKAGSELHAKILRKVGADAVVFPERDTAERIARRLTSPTIFDFIELSADYSIVEIVAPDFLVGKTLKETGFRARYGAYVIAIKRKTPEYKEGNQIDYREEVIIAPSPDEEILKGDLLVLLGKVKDIEKLKRSK